MRVNAKYLKTFISLAQWLTPAILNTWEEEIMNILV